VFWDVFILVLRLLAFPWLTVVLSRPALLADFSKDGSRPQAFWRKSYWGDKRGFICLNTLASLWQSKGTRQTFSHAAESLRTLLVAQAISYIYKKCLNICAKAGFALVFDTASAALVRSEKQCVKCILELLKRRTVLTLTHNNWSPKVGFQLILKFVPKKVVQLHMHVK